MHRLWRCGLVVTPAQLHASSSCFLGMPAHQTRVLSSRPTTFRLWHNSYARGPLATSRTTDLSEAGDDMSKSHTACPREAL